MLSIFKNKIIYDLMT